LADPNSPPSDDPFAFMDGDSAGLPKPEPQSAPAAPVANDNSPDNSPNSPNNSPTPEGDDPFAFMGDIGPSKVSKVGEFARGAERGALPMVGGIAGAEAGAGLGAIGGSVLGPAGTFFGGIGGGLAGAFMGSTAIAKVQDWGVKHLSESWQDALGLSEKQEQKDESTHDGMSFLGGLFPAAMTMNPSLAFRGAPRDLAPNATRLQRILAHPASGKLFGGLLGATVEAGREKGAGEDLSLGKIGTATVFGTVFNQPNRVGAAISRVGQWPARLLGGQPHPATLAEVADSKTFGPGITESVYQGTQEQAPDAAMTAQQNARDEQESLGEPPEPDVHAIAQTMEPELFKHYDDLLKRRETFGPHEVDGQTIPALTSHLARNEAEIQELSPHIAAAYRRAADTVGTGTVEAEPFPTMAHMLAAHEAGTGRPNETQEQVPQQPEPVPVPGVPGVQPSGEAPGIAGGPEPTPVPGAPSPQRTIGAQRAFIADDTARRLIAAGRPEEEARAAGQLIAARYVTRAGRFAGKLGTPEELYARESAAIGGPTGRAQEPAIPPREVTEAAEANARQVAATPASQPGVVARDFETSDRVKNEWRQATPFKDDVDGFIAASKPNQEALATVGRELAGELGLDFKDPGVKAPGPGKGLDRLVSKSKRFGSIGSVTDQVRAGFNVETPQQADRVIERLGQQFQVTDEGWQTTPAGYFDRKLYIRFPDGMIGEVQIWPPGMLAAKEHGGGHVLYEGVRELPQWHPLIPEFNRAQSELYGPVRAALSGEWKAALGSGGSEPNLLPNEAAESTAELRPTSAALTSSQEPLTSAQASEGVQNAGKPSQETDLTTDMFGVPNENVGPHTAPVNAAIDAVDHINSLTPAEQKREIPKYTPSAETAPKGVDQPVGTFMFDPTALNIDASRFQFKSGGDEYGVTGALRNVTKWDQAKAQSIIVWEQNDGKLFVADGHQRAGLARRLTEKEGAKGIELPGLLYREKDGISAGDIKAMAAVTNIANGSGSALDGAKVLRERPDLMDGSLPLSTGKGKQAAALARLGDEPFRMVLNDVVPEHYGAVVGELIPNDPARQEAAIKAIARFEPKNADEAAVLTQRVAQAELAKAEAGSQTSMFGDLETPESTAGEEMKIVGRAISDLKKDKSLFARVLANAERIEQTGSSIERGAAESVASDAEIFAKQLTSDAYTAGPIRTELIAAAKDLKDGKTTAADASRRIIDALRAQAEAHGADRAGDSGGVEPAKEYAQNDEDLFEAGAEGKPQQLIPGVKPVSQRDLIQAAANKPLTAKKPQKAVGGLFGDSMDQKELFQTARGSILISPNARPIIKLMKEQNASTFVHESGHQFLEEMVKDAQHPEAPDDLKADVQTVRDWLGAPDELKTKHHEKFARGFEQYLREGVAPSPELAGVFAKFRNWLLQIYQSIKGLGTEISPEIRNVFDRMLEQEPNRTVIAPERPAGGPLLHEVHEGDAVGAEPHEAGALADRAMAERARYVAEPQPEIANEIQGSVQKVEAEQAAAGGGANAGAENAGGAVGPSEVEPGGGGPGSEPGGGGVGAGSGPVGGGGGGAETESSTAVRPDPRAKLGDHAGTALAPGPSDLFGAGESPFADRAGNIRIENLTTREDVAQAIKDSAAENNDFIGDRRGKITDGQVGELAEALGMDEAMLNKRGIGQAFNAEQIVAARRLLIQSATGVSAAMKKAATGTDEDVMAYAEAKDRHQLIQAQVAGITAEAGRALRAFRDISGGAEGEKAKAVDQFIKEATGKTLFQLRAEAKLGAELETPQQVSKFMHDAGKHSFGRIVLEYWINGLISGPATHMTYMAGNTISAIMKVPESLAASAVGSAAEAMGRTGARVRPGEALALAQGGFKGIAPAIKAAIEAGRTGITTELPGEGPNQASLPFQPGTELARGAQFDEHATFHDAMSAAYGLVQGMKDTVVSTAALVSAGGIKGEPLVSRVYNPNRATPNIAYRGVTVLPTGDITTLPSRGVAVIHSFFRSLVFSMEKNALAYRQAAEEGHEGTALHARVAQLRTDPSQTVMNEAATHEATEAALMGKGSELTQRLAALTNTPIFGAPLLKFIDPFVRVSGNIIDQSLIRRTPVGLLTMFGPETELARDLTGKNGNIAQDKAIGRMMVGTALAVTFGSLAAQKMLSGSGPKDPKEARVWMMAGNQPHSIRIGDTWYQVNKLGPMGMLASISADLYDVAHEAEQGDMTKAGAHLLHAITQNVLDESAMHGPAEMLKAIETPDRYGESYIRNYLSAFVPFSVGLGQIGRAADPYQRDTRTLIDTIRNKIPGHLDSYFDKELPVRRDIWGEPLPSRTALGGAGVSAIYEQRVNSDPVNQAMWKVGVFPGTVQRKIMNVDLTPEQYDDYARLAGRMAKMRLDKMVLSPQFQSWTPSHQHDVMMEVIKQSRSVAQEAIKHQDRTIITRAHLQKTAKKQAINDRNPDE
jgi:hypothetical protein